MEPTQVPAPERRLTHSAVSTKPLAAAVIALAALRAGPADAQQAPSSSASSSTELQEVVVTGSLIKRTDTETPSPVQVITDQDLKRSEERREERV